MNRCLAALLLIPLTTASAAGQNSAPARLFNFQSNFLENLHHLLYQHAQAPQCPQGQINGECAHYYDIAPADQNPWSRAVQWYAANLVKRSLVFDEEMARINNTLAALAPDANLDHRGLPEGLVDALRTAAPVYRKYWWPDQEYWNQRWVETVMPRLERSANGMAQHLVEIYGEPWPTTPIRVDLVGYAGPDGAYTTVGPPHVVISATERRNQGESALQVLFREASRALTRKIWNALATDFRARQHPVPQDLWEALLSYTAGEVVRGVVPGYVPPATRFQELMERDWKPYLEGKTDLDSALAKLAAEY